VAPIVLAWLFFENTVNNFRPNDPESWRGRDAIVAGWLEAQDAPETWKFDFTVPGVISPTEGNEFGMDVVAAPYRDAERHRAGLRFIVPERA
jgi:hypothetical protein